MVQSRPESFRETISGKHFDGSDQTRKLKGDHYRQQFDGSDQIRSDETRQNWTKLGNTRQN